MVPSCLSDPPVPRTVRDANLTEGRNQKRLNEGQPEGRPCPDGSLVGGRTFEIPSLAPWGFSPRPPTLACQVGVAEGMSTVRP